MLNWRTPLQDWTSDTQTQLDTKSFREDFDSVCLTLCDDHRGMVFVFMTVYVRDRNELQCCLNCDFHLLHNLLSVYSLILWLLMSTASAGLQEGARRSSRRQQQAASSHFFGFSCCDRTAFSHFVMQHTVCVSNVKWLNEKVVLQQLVCCRDKTDEDELICLSTVSKVPLEVEWKKQMNKAGSSLKYKSLDTKTY